MKLAAVLLWDVTGFACAESALVKTSPDIRLIDPNSLAPLDGFKECHLARS
jgi:hypothetical protein